MTGSQGLLGKDGPRDARVLPRVLEIGRQFFPRERPERIAQGHALTDRLERPAAASRME